MPLHKTITAERVCAAAERYHSSLDNPGFCTACGAEVDGVEPDAENYECEICGADAVCGAEELLIGPRGGTSATRSARTIRP